MTVLVNTALSRPNPSKPVPRCFFNSKEWFEAEHLQPKLPVVFDGLARDWPAFDTWDFDSIAACAGDDPVLLMLDGDRAQGARQETTVGEYLHSFDKIRATPTRPSQHAMVNDAGPRFVPYLREWNFARRHPELLEDIAPAKQLFEDRFSQWPAADQPQLTWLFIGPAGAYTPLHRDLWHTDAWIAQLRGRKLVRMWSPAFIDTLSRRDTFVDLSVPDLAAFPNCLTVPCLETILEPGDVLYLPADFLHEVLSLDDSISVSSNFMGVGSEALVRPHLEDWLERRHVSREIDTTERRLRMLTALEGLPDDSEDEDEDNAQRMYTLSAKQRAALDEKPSLEHKLHELRALPHLTEWRPTTL